MKTFQISIRTDDDTKEMLDQLTEHFTALYGSADMSFSARVAIRKMHKDVYPEMWTGQYYRPELTKDDAA